MKDREKSVEKTENLEQSRSRERGADAPRDLEPSPNQRTVQPSDRTRKSP